MAYNGWTNYETWNVALWIDNDQSSYHMRQEWAQDAWDNAAADNTFTRVERATLDLANVIKEYVEENNPLGDQASMYSDMLGAAISEVNWHEIAENWMGDVDKDKEEEGEEE